MNREQKKLRKRKKREKNKKKFLSKQRTSESHPKLTSRASNEIPKRDDRLAWTRFNKLKDGRAIIKKACELYPKERIVKEFKKYGFECVERKKDERELSRVLTHAVQVLYANPPYFIPIVFANSNGMKIESFGPTKKPGIQGAIYELKEKTSINDKKYSFGFSSHALERLYERVAPCLGTLSMMTGFTYFFRIIMLGSVVPSDDVYRVTLMIGGKILGYCPSMIENNDLVAKTFLLPGMRFTPEIDLFAEEEIENVLDLIVRAPKLFDDGKYFDFRDAHGEVLAAYEALSHENETEES